MGCVLHSAMLPLIQSIVRYINKNRGRYMDLYKRLYTLPVESSIAIPEYIDSDKAVYRFKVLDMLARPLIKVKLLKSVGRVEELFRSVTVDPDVSKQYLAEVAIAVVTLGQNAVDRRLLPVSLDDVEYLYFLDVISQIIQCFGGIDLCQSAGIYIHESIERIKKFINTDAEKLKHIIDQLSNASTKIVEMRMLHNPITSMITHDLAKIIERKTLGFHIDFPSLIALSTASYLASKTISEVD